MLLGKASVEIARGGLRADAGSVSPQLVEIYGHDVHVFLFRSLINHLDLKSSKPPTDQTRLQLLTQELGAVMARCFSPRPGVEVQRMNG